jgi:MEMO1 family protein
MSIRKAVVSGSFYPNDKKEILEYFNQFNSLKKDIEIFEDVKAIIVPHAGYIYSGYTANLAYSCIKKQKPKRVIVIGPSHRVYLKGGSVSLYDEYETPLGNIQIDKTFSENLIEKYDFLDFNIECEFEHSTETQMPFIKYYFKDSSVVEIVYGDIDFNDLSKLIDNLLEDDNNFIVISTDLSHFHSESEANKFDNNCINAIKNKDLNLFDYGEACGKVGVKAMIKSSINKNYKTQILDYCTSAKITGDKSRVVGYTSALIGV